MNGRAPLVVLTGGSSGLGAAMATELANTGHRVLTLARRRSDALPPAVLQWQADLSDPLPVARKLQAWLAEQPAEQLTSATLISNAGTNTSPGPLAQADLAEVSRAMRVDLEAAVLLTGGFLAATRGWPIPRKILLISSGVARQPLAGAATYGAAKAGLDHLARTVALEEKADDNGARIVALAPGRFETGMMALMRDADPDRFPARADFIALKDQDQLNTPEKAAADVLRYLDRPDFGHVAVADVRDTPSPGGA